MVKKVQRWVSSYCNSYSFLMINPKFAITKNVGTSGIIKKLSLIQYLRYLICIKYKNIGRFLNNTNYNPLVNLILIWLMFIIDNLILYYNLLHIYNIYGLSIELLIHIELKGLEV